MWLQILPSTVRPLQITFLFPSLGVASPDHLSPSFTWCGYSRKISQGCSLSKSPFSFLHLVRLLQITFSLPSLGTTIVEKSLKGTAIPDHFSFFLHLVWLLQIVFPLPSLGAAVLDHLSFSFTWYSFSRPSFPFLHLVRLLHIIFPLPSLGAAVLEKSLKGAAIPDHFSLSFTWCSFSRSPFPFLHLVRLLWKNLSRVRLFQITFLLPSLGVASPDHLSPFFTWCGYFGKSHLGVAVPNHLSLSFTWCSFSRSPFPFLHLVRLFWKNLSRVQLFYITFLFSSFGIASPDHFSPFFTWYGCSWKISLGCGRSPCFSMVLPFSFPTQCFLTSRDLLSFFGAAAPSPFLIIFFSTFLMCNCQFLP